MPSKDDLRTTLSVYGYPSQALWRAFERDALRKIPTVAPILELGCADGAFTRSLWGPYSQIVDLGIDINPRAIERAKSSRVFKEARVQDARELSGENFAMVISNSVLEHIPNVKSVIEGAYRALRPNGDLIITVPLIDMNKHMLFGKSWITRRQNKLAHVNLWPLETWLNLLREVGFTIYRDERFFGPRQVRVWDVIDSLTVIGTQRVNIGSISKAVKDKLPGFISRGISNLIASFLSGYLRDSGAGCVALIVARKPSNSPRTSSPA